jgi:cobalt-zinc-cadmium efflux system outer membrane protein
MLTVPFRALSLLFTSALLVLPAVVRAADPPFGSVGAEAAPIRVSLDELVTQVVRSNPELEFYRAELAAAEGGRQSAAQWSNPELSGDVGYKEAWLRSGPKLGDGVAWSVSVAQTFEFPGRLSLRKALANGQIAMARLGLAQAEAALAGRARTLGFQLHAAHERAVATRGVATRLDALVEVLVQRGVDGVTPRLDQRILEAHAITLNRRALEADREWQQAMIALNQLRGEPALCALHLTGVEFVPTNAPSPAVLVAAAQTDSFEVRQRQLELEQQGFEIALRKNERWPSVTLAPFYTQEQAADEERTIGLGISLPLPLWNRQGGAIEVARAREQQAAASLRAVLLEVEARVTGHALALESRMAEIRRWRRDAPAEFREAAELADRHYRLGAVPVTTYVEMQLQYLEALEALMTTRGEALEHWYALELLVGQPLQTLN